MEQTKSANRSKIDQRQTYWVRCCHGHGTQQNHFETFKIALGNNHRESERRICAGKKKNESKFISIDFDDKGKG